MVRGERSGQGLGSRVRVPSAGLGPGLGPGLGRRVEAQVRAR